MFCLSFEFNFCIFFYRCDQTLIRSRCEATAAYRIFFLVHKFLFYTFLDTTTSTIYTIRPKTSLCWTNKNLATNFMSQIYGIFLYIWYSVYVDAWRQPGQRKTFSSAPKHELNNIFDYDGTSPLFFSSGCDRLRKLTKFFIHFMSEEHRLSKRRQKRCCLWKL